ncbi:MAG: hypothetical protein AAF845_08900 [Bacteroidota bacterium]
MPTLRSVLPLLVLGVLLTGCFSTGSSSRASSGSSASSGSNASLVVVNNTNQSVFYLYASSCSNSSWGPDRLGDDVITSGSTMSFSMTTGCWDLKAVMRDGREVVRRNANITSSDWRWTIG